MKNGQLCNAPRRCICEINKNVLKNIKDGMTSFGLMFVAKQYDVTFEVASYIAQMSDEDIDAVSKRMPPLVKIA